MVYYDVSTITSITKKWYVSMKCEQIYTRYFKQTYKVSQYNAHIKESSVLLLWRPLLLSIIAHFDYGQIHIQNV